METQDNIPYNLFAKFFSGEILEDEQKILDKFISENPKNEIIFEEYQKIWSENSDNDQFENKTEQALQSVKNKISKPEKNIAVNNKKLWIRIAASIIIVFGLSYFFYENTQITDVKYTIVTSNENIKEIKLADGTVVWINKNSKLEFPEKFAKNKRIVKMTGEAYFIVAHNKKKPFIVKTENTETEVLGTEFNLKSFDKEQDIEIVLKKGKVKFTDTQSNVSEIMNVNDKIILNKKARNFKKEKVTNDNFLSWKTKELNFNNMKLDDVAKTLSESYNIKVKTDNSAKDIIFNSSLPFTKIEDILTTLKITVGIKIDTVKGEIVFRKD